MELDDPLWILMNDDIGAWKPRFNGLLDIVGDPVRVQQTQVLVQHDVHLDELLRTV